MPRARPRRKRRAGGRKAKAILKQDRVVMALGRNFPPTVLRWTAENVLQRRWANASVAARGYNVFKIRCIPDGSGITYWSTANSVFQAQVGKDPQNWDRITALYKRGRVLSFTVKVEAQVPGDAATAQSWNAYFWSSSTLDDTNPITLNGAANLPAATWAGSEDQPASARTILDSSRRVVRMRMAGVMTKNGQNHLKYVVKVSPYRDRVGNIMVGGKHVRIAQDHGGGAANTTDDTVANLLNVERGVAPSINCVLLPTSLNNGLFAIVSTRITIFAHMELYDRDLTVG